MPSREADGRATPGALPSPPERIPATFGALTVAVDGDELVCEHAEIAPLAATLGVLVWGGSLALATRLSSAFHWAPMAAATLVHAATESAVGKGVRRATRRHALATFCAAEVEERRIRLHWRDAARAPLELHLASWNARKLVAVLDAGAPGLTAARAPDHPPRARDPLAGLPGLVPLDRSPRAILAGALLSTGALVAGALAWSTGGQPSLDLRLVALLLWFSAAVPWLVDRRRGGAIARADAGRVALRVRREERDVLRLLSPWVRAELHAAGVELALVRRQPSGFESALVCGAAILGAAVALGRPTPLAALAAALPLLASGYPRPDERAETLPRAQLRRLELRDDAATLHLLADDGTPRAIALRLPRRAAARLVGVVRAVAPELAIDERAGAERAHAAPATVSSQQLGAAAARLDALRRAREEARRP